MTTKPSRTALILALLASAAFFPVARAATLTVISNGTAATIGAPFEVDVQLDTQGSDMNAIQGTVTFPTSLFSLQSINDGRSMISLWVDAPAEIASGEVEFSGIVPGGFMGDASSVIGLVLTPLAPGTGTIALQDVELLSNDGSATPLAVTSTGEDVSVSVPPPGFTAPTSTVSVIAPNPFLPVIATDANVYNGEYFLTFSTTDKGSGIAYYEVLEVPTGHLPSVVSSWQRATSPYLLQDQTLSSNIYVRAVDHAGNFIVAKLPAEHPAPSATVLRARGVTLVALGILLLFILAVGVLYVVIRRKRMVR